MTLDQRLAESPEVATAKVARGGTGAWSWIMQRATGAFLLFFLGAHLWLLHYSIAGQQIQFDRVIDRLGSPFFVFLDAGLLAVAIYHGLNGLRAVLMDLSFGPRIDKPLSWSFFVLGVLTFVFGINALLAFTTGQPLFAR